MEVPWRKSCNSEHNIPGSKQNTGNTVCLYEVSNDSECLYEASNNTVCLYEASNGNVYEYKASITME